ncbi:hypothetical protein SLA2020_470410 [Shorea laevis]
MDNDLSPPPCPNTVTVRRNPHRRARPTPSTTKPPPGTSSASSGNLPQIPFPIQDILSIEIPQSETAAISDSQPPSFSSDDSESENLKVYLRIRPLVPPTARGSTKFPAEQSTRSRAKNVWPQNPAKKNTVKEKNPTKKAYESCIKVGDDACSVTLSPPAALQDSKRSKSEVYEGFSHVFSADSTQIEVYERMVNPLVEDFLKGKSLMLAALGSTGSGKTHTMFGSPREPGMVPLALQRIFKPIKGCGSESSRKFFLSVFEVYADGKAERICDLCPDGTDLCVQQSPIKGIQEVLIHDAAEPESLIARAMLKRSTAATNANSQSSRSQCIINISTVTENEKDVQSNCAVLTFVDLAGAEREKRTGNQGARLLESNFINNTSLVFGLCLRSLLEHQKNPKKPLQKHFQNSLLTRHLRDYLEGKKQMTLILTVKPGEEDYLDTSYLLRQASPYMKIKFAKVEDESSLHCNKRHFQTLSRPEQPKRMKVSRTDARKNEEKVVGDENQHCKEDAPQRRNYQIMQNFAKALLNVLKEYKEKLKVAETEILNLRGNLSYEKTRSLELEKKLDNLKSCCTCSKEEQTSYSVDEDNNSRYSKAEVGNSSSNSAENLECPNDQNELDIAVVEYTNQKHESFPVKGNINEFSELSDGVVVEDDKPNTEATEIGVNSSGDDNSSFIDQVQQLNENDEDNKSAYSKDEVDNTSRISAENLDCHNDQNELDIAVVEYTNQKHGSFPVNEDVNEVSEESDCVVEDGNPKTEATEIGVSSSGDDNSLSIDLVQQLNENDEDAKDLSVSLKELMGTQECDIANVPHTATIPIATCKPPDIEKPKRRLLPASSVLLRNVRTLDVDDDVATQQKPKGNRGGKKSAVEERQKTQGSISLLRLLQRNPHL